MSERPRRRAHRAPRELARGVPILLGAGATIALAFALYLGLEVGEPPPAPDLERLAEDRTGQDGDDGRWTPLVLPEQDPTAGVPETPPGAGIRILRAPPPPRGARPRLAIVIDDLGRSVADIDRLRAIGVPLTYAVLPFESRTPEVVARLAAAGEEIFCHLPMEAKNGLDPGPGALRREMSAGELIAATRRALEAVPGAVGVNNHMGSEISTAPEALRAMLGVLRERGLLYLDSRTTAETLGYTLAHDLGVAAGERQVFLDTVRDPEAIRGQLAELLALASRRGGAIAIAHPYPETLEVLAEELPRVVAEGYELVTASALLGAPG